MNLRDRYRLILIVLLGIFLILGISLTYFLFKGASNTSKNALNQVQSQPITQASSQSVTKGEISKTLDFKFEVVSTESGKIKGFLKVSNKGQENVVGLYGGVYLRTYREPTKITLPAALKNITSSTPLTLEQKQNLASAAATAQKSPFATDQLVAYKEIPLPTIVVGKDIVVSIEFTLPATIKSDKYNLQSFVLTDLGKVVVGDSTIVTLGGSNEFLSLPNDPCWVNVDNLFYDPQQAALINPGQRATGECKFTNTTQKPISVKSYQGNYGVFSSIQYPLSVKMPVSSSSAVIINPNETKKIIFTIPDAKTPQVYQTLLQLINTQNQPVSPFISLRWTLKGPSAKIENAGLDKSFYSKGDTITSNITASPSMDLYWNTHGNRGSALNDPQLKVSVLNESKQICGSTTKSLPKTDTPDPWPAQTITFKSAQDCSNPQLEVQLFEGNQKLDDYNRSYQSLANTRVQPKKLFDNKTLWIALGAVVIIFLIILVLLVKSVGFKQPKVLSLILILGCLSIIGLYSSSINKPVYGQTPGATAPNVNYPFAATYNTRGWNSSCDYPSFAAGTCTPSPGAYPLLNATDDYIYGGLPGSILQNNGNGTSNLTIVGQSYLVGCGNNTQETPIDIYIDGAFYTEYIQGGNGPISFSLGIPTPRNLVEVYFYGHWMHFGNDGVEGDPTFMDAEAWTQNNVYWSALPAVTPGAFTLSAPVPVCSAAPLQVVLSWTPSSNADSYNVFRADLGLGAPLNSSPLPAGTTTFTDTTVAQNTSYNYYVRAYNNTYRTQKDSDPAPSVLVTTPQCTPTLTSFSGSGACVSQDTPKINLNWTAGGSTSYDLSRLPTGGVFPTTVADSPPNNFTDTAVSPLASYQYTNTPKNSFTSGLPVTTSVTAPKCNVAISISSLIGNRCYTLADWTALQPIRAQITPPLDSGVTYSATFKNEAGSFPTSCDSSGVCSVTLPFVPGGYNLQVQGHANYGAQTFNSSWTPASPIQYLLSVACIGPWIQTKNGDVHSNSNINIPGGP